MTSPSGLNDVQQCIFETPTVASSRKRVHNSVTNLRSHKRSRNSMTSADTRANVATEAAAGTSSHVPNSSKADRFIPRRPKMLMPLDITPRTRRISKQFGLVDDRLLNFKDDTNIFTSTYKDDSTIALIRRSASSLFNTTLPSRPTSVTENLNKRRSCLMVLDSPGVSMDQEACPITWSNHNCIAVSCRNSVYYQNLDTKSVSHLCSTTYPGQIGVIQWGNHRNDRHLALGTTSGTVQVWDANIGGSGTCLHTWSTADKGSAKSLSWHRDVLAVGFEIGEINLTDVRTPREALILSKHKSRVVGLQWSPNGDYLASGDKDGIVHIWDRRIGKSLLDGGHPLDKLRHKGSTKAIAWCPWKPDLIATGSAAPEGKIKIWSTSSPSTTHTHEPIHTIPLNTSVLSLHWSPHCKELLSTHGSSFAPILSVRRRASLTINPTTTATNTPQPKLAYTKTPLTNSIAVHDYPSCTRLMTLTNAHSQAISHSCLSPNGESIFTVCPREESIKMWQVWSVREPEPKRPSSFDKYIIR